MRVQFGSESLSRFVGIRNAQIFLKNHHRIPQKILAMLWLLDGIKPDKRPTSDADMEVLHKAVDWIFGGQVKADRVYIEAVSATLFKDGVPGFRSLLKRCCPSHNPDNPFHDLADFLTADAETLGHKTVSPEILDALLKEWIREAGLISLLTASERWHATWWEQKIDIKAVSWVPLLASPQRVGNLVLHELSDTQALVEEGCAMHHCIASYAALCAAGDDFIFSLRSEEGRSRRRSTLHIGRNGSGQFTIKEHRAFANREPDQESIDAARQFVNAISATAPSNKKQHTLARQ